MAKKELLLNCTESFSVNKCILETGTVKDELTYLVFNMEDTRLSQEFRRNLAYKVFYAVKDEISRFYGGMADKKATPEDLRKAKDATSQIIKKMMREDGNV